MLSLLLRLVDVDDTRLSPLDLESGLPKLKCQLLTVKTVSEKRFIVNVGREILLVPSQR